MKTTSAQKEEIKKRYENKETVSEIAKKVGVDRGTVYYHLGLTNREKARIRVYMRKYGIPPPPRQAHIPFKREFSKKKRFYNVKTNYERRGSMYAEYLKKEEERKNKLCSIK